MKKMRDYFKKKQEESGFDLIQDDADVVKLDLDINRRRIGLTVSVFLCSIFLVLFFVQRGLNQVSLGEEGMVELTSMPIASATVKRSVISVPAGVVKANPFLPYRNIGDQDAVGDIPNLEVIEPPETLNANSDAARIMDTIVSGILYDKFSPSAILNIEGNDYLVKKGDVVNNYKVLSIVEDSVTVKLGANVYKAGIGEILTEGTLNHNNISNLNNKFGGVQ